MATTGSKFRRLSTWRRRQSAEALNRGGGDRDRVVFMKWESFIRSPVFSGLATFALLVRLSVAGLSWPGVVLLLAVLLWFAFTLIDWLVHWHRRRGEQRLVLDSTVAKMQAPLSLVFLLAEPRRVSVESVSRCVRDALGLDGAADELVVEASPVDFSRAAGGETEKGGGAAGERQFLVRLPDGVYGVLVFSAPYQSGAVTRATSEDKRLRTSVENHQGWLSVDLVSATPEEPEGCIRAYATIGKLLAAMAGPDCLAIYAPEIGGLNEFDPMLIELLRSGEPLSIFEEPTFDPVVEIEEDDPRMAEAISEALRRWPEFCAAFFKRENPGDDRFIIKAEFVEGDHSEFMWVAVTEISGTRVTGLLMNDPHELETVHRGMEVSVEVGRLNDWLFHDEEGEAVGGFTLRVLEDQSRESREGRPRKPGGDSSDDPRRDGDHGG